MGELDYCPGDASDTGYCLICMGFCVVLPIGISMLIICAVALQPDALVDVAAKEAVAGVGFGVMGFSGFVGGITCCYEKHPDIELARDHKSYNHKVLFSTFFMVVVFIIGYALSMNGIGGSLDLTDCKNPGGAMMIAATCITFLIGANHVLICLREMDIFSGFFESLGGFEYLDNYDKKFEERYDEQSIEDSSNIRANDEEKDGLEKSPASTSLDVKKEPTITIPAVKPEPQESVVADPVANGTSEEPKATATPSPLPRTTDIKPPNFCIRCGGPSCYSIDGFPSCLVKKSPKGGNKTPMRRLMEKIHAAA